MSPYFRVDSGLTGVSVRGVPVQHSDEQAVESGSPIPISNLSIPVPNIGQSLQTPSMDDTSRFPIDNYASMGPDTGGEDEQDDEPDPILDSNSLDKTAAAAHPMLFISGSTGPLSLRGLLNPSSIIPTSELHQTFPVGSASGVSDVGLGGRTTSSSRRKGDIVSRRIISLEMAHHLYSL